MAFLDTDCGQSELTVPGEQTLRSHHSCTLTTQLLESVTCTVDHKCVVEDILTVVFASKYEHEPHMHCMHDGMQYAAADTYRHKCDEAMLVQCRLGVIDSAK